MSISVVESSVAPKSDGIALSSCAVPKRERPESPPPSAPRSSESKLEGERRHVTILFADISGFTSMSESLDPEQVTDIMNECFKRLGSVITRNEGYIDKFIGDCIMALFGAPIAHENDPELAVNSALEMIDELHRLNEERSLSLGMSFGINSGLVVAGGVGSESRLDYTVMGDAVNLASRLQSNAKRDQILVSKPVFRACEKIFDFQPLSAIQVKGKKDPVEIFEVTGRAKPTKREEPKASTKNELIGRERELQIAEQLLDRIAQGQGQILLVSAEAGLGKSQLKRAIQKSSLGRGMTWLEGRCSTKGRASAFWVIVDLIKRMVEIDELDSSELRARKLEPLSAHDIEPAGLTLLQSFIVPDLSAPVESDPAQKQALLFSSVRKLFRSLSREKPLVLFFDDAHFIDPLSESLLTSLMESIQRNRILLYFSFRPDFKPAWSTRPNATPIHLQPLPPEAMIKFIRVRMETPALPPRLERLVIEKADGNPLYAEEILKNLIDLGQLIRSESGWEFSEGGEGFELPPTLQGMIAARIDRLEEVPKLVAQYASVIGKEFRDRLVIAACGLSDDLCIGALEILRERGLIVEVASEEDYVEYVFHHALTHEVTYQTILQKKSRSYHARVAESIERLYSTQLQDHVDALAFHYSKAGNSVKAIDFLTRSGRKQVRDFNYPGAIDRFEKALAMISESAALTQGQIRQRCQILLDLAECSIAVAKYEQAQRYNEEAIQASEQIGDYALIAQSLLNLGDVARMRGHTDEALNYLTRALTASQQADHFEYAIRIYRAIGNVHHLRHNLDEGLANLERSHEGAKQLGNPRLIAEALNDIAIVHIQRGRLNEAEKALMEGREVSETYQLRHLLVRQYINLGVIQYYQNNLDEALSFFQLASEKAQEIGDLRNSMLATHNIGDVYLQKEQWIPALECFEKSYSRARELESEIDQVKNIIFIGYLKGRLGEVEVGIGKMEAAIERANEKMYWEYYCVGLIYLARLYYYLGNGAKGRALLEQSLHKAREVGFETMVKECEGLLADSLPPSEDVLKAGGSHKGK